ncbi:MAG: hypothetical protein JXQ73_06560 [Phycisphaerae bacterium]|nr:hypothetical protein [Phycisphaerae bacterium]
MSQTGVGTRRYALICIGLISCSMLMYEILLTRVCALRLYFHFGFLVVSNCLLMIGASGSLISVRQDFFKQHLRWWIWAFAVLYVISLALTYAFLLTYEAPPGIRLASFGEVCRFTVFNGVAAVPFFFAGSVIGLILTFNAEQVNKLYFLDLLGAGLGCLICPLGLWMAGAGGCLVFLALLGLIVIAVAAPPARRRLTLSVCGIAGLVGLAILPRFDRWCPVPCKSTFLTQSFRIEIPRFPPYSRWSVNSRVDMVDTDPAFASQLILGRGHKGAGNPVPTLKGIMQDGSAWTVIVDWSDHPEMVESLRTTAYGLASLLKKDPSVFIIGAGGGNDVWGAKVAGAKTIKAVELNSQIIDIHRNVLPDFSRGITQDPNIQLVCAEGRSAIMREATLYDIVQMTGIDTWTSLTSGAYVLAENYLYTTEAIQGMYDRIKDDGILSITRSAREMETLRVLSTIDHAIADRRRGRLENAVVCLICDVAYMSTTLVKKGEFTDAELATLDRAVNEEGFAVVYHPKRDLGTLVERFVRTPDKATFVRRFPRNIAPTYDDCPYFFNFTKWSKFSDSAKLTKEPTHVSQGNPVFIFIQFLISTVLSLVLILIPVLAFRRKGITKAHLVPLIVYFVCLGLGFISIEIAMMQKLVLFLGHPIYSVTVTLFAMLVFTGFGSLISERWFREPTRRVWAVPVLLAILLVAFVVLSPRMVVAWIHWPTWKRILVTVAVLMPIGLPLGVPFAYGIRLLNRFNPTLIPLAWAVNGCLTVIGSILTVILSMNLGFNFVLLSAIPIYVVGFYAVRRLC